MFLSCERMADEFNVSSREFDDEDFVKKGGVELCDEIEWTESELK